MPWGYGSVGVNDQLVPVPVKAAYNPINMGPAYTGPGMWPRQGVYNLPPVLPSPDLQATMPPQSWGQTTGEGTIAQEEPSSPFSFKQSPLWWGLGALIVGLVLLRYVHWRG
jgi:hypothetical protein